MAKLDKKINKIFSSKTALIILGFLFLLLQFDIISINNPFRQKNRDLDLDGFESLEFEGDDCNDKDARINPEAQDIPDDGIDQDCDGKDSSIADSILSKDDIDGDNFASNVDCDDTDKEVNPKVKEIYNLIDDNCENGIDEGFEKITVLEDFVIPDYTSSTIIKNSKTIVVSGNIREAYLYIKAGVDRPLRRLTKFDSIYLYFNLPDTSGHLVRSKSLNTTDIGDDLTTLVYDLSEVSFTGIPYQEGKVKKIRDLRSLLNEGDLFNLGAFVATERYGQIVELTIGYKGGNLRLK